LGRDTHPLPFIVGGPRWRVRAGHLVVAVEVALDEVALLEGVLDWIAMIVARHLDYLVKTDIVELASLLFVDPIDYRNELAVVAPLAVLLALHSSVAVLGLVRGFSLSLTLVLPEYYVDGLLAEGMACCEVKQLPHCSWFTAPELVNESFVDHARDECSYHIRIHDIGKLVALLGKAMDVLA
jgi:hypothetical protein